MEISGKSGEGGTTSSVGVCTAGDLSGDVDRAAMPSANVTDPFRRA